MRSAVKAQAAPVGYVQALRSAVAVRVNWAVALARDTTTAGMARVTSARQMVTNALTAIDRRGLIPWGKETAVLLRKALGVQAEAAQRQALEAATTAKGKAAEARKATGEFVSKKSVQTTAASAATGAMALGAGGGVSGLAAGTALGAAAGLPFALFTFGLSIPIGAALGGGSGLAMGAAAGATVGAVGGGAAGYGAFNKQNEIRSAAKQVASTATDGAEYVKGTAMKSAGYVKGVATNAATSARARFAGASTGGTGN